MSSAVRPRERSLNNAFLYLRRSMAVIGLLAALTITSNSQVEGSVESLFFAAVMATGLAMLPLLWMRDADPFGPLSYFCFTYIFSYLGILASLVVNGSTALPHLPLGYSDRARIGIQAILLNSTWLVGYALAFVYVTARSESAGASVQSSRTKGWSSPRLWIVTLVCSVVFVAAYAQFQSLLGISIFNLTALREGKAAWREDATLSYMIRGIQIGFLPVLFWGARVFLRGTRTQVAVVVLVGMVLALLVNRLGQRSMGAAPLMALAGIFHYTRRRVPWAVIFAAVFALVIYINITSRLRTGASSTFDEAAAESSTGPLSAFSQHEDERGRLDSTATILFFFPDRVPYLWGESWAPVVTALVPRWLWPTKSQHYPYSDTRMLRTLVGIPAPTPIPALLYANFTWLGVPIGGALWGAVHSRLYRWLLRNRGYEGTPILYLLALVFIQPTATGVANALQYLVPAYLILRFVEVRLQPEGRAVSDGRTLDEKRTERQDL